MASFKARTQYGDWEGTASADNLIEHDLWGYLTDKELISEGEFLIGVSLFTAPADPINTEGFVSVSAFVTDGKKFEEVQAALSGNSGPVKVREISLDLNMADFLRLFKRFAVVLTWHGLDLEGREYDNGK